MRVRCESIVSITGKEVDYHPGIKIGELYDVVSILCRTGRNPLIQILNGDRPSLWPSTMFTVVTPKIDPDWEIGISETGTIEIGPPKFQTPGFWELYFEDDPEALQIFDEEFLKHHRTSEQ